MPLHHNLRLFMKLPEKSKFLDEDNLFGSWLDYILWHSHHTLHRFLLDLISLILDQGRMKYLGAIDPYVLGKPMIFVSTIHLLYIPS
jgi:hypothetical protein